MNRLTLWVCAVALVGVALPALAGNRRVAPKPVDGKKVKELTRVANKSIKWHKDFATLKERAAKSKRMIFWMQIVGELDGGL